MLLVGFAGIAVTVQRLLAHHIRQALGSLAIDYKILSLQPDCKLPGSVERGLIILFIKQTQNGQILFIFTAGFEIQSAAMKSQQSALSYDTQRTVFVINHGTTVTNRLCYKFFFKKSFSTFNCPIWAYSFSVCFS
jgi:hypothetical protein